MLACWAGNLLAFIRRYVEAKGILLSKWKTTCGHAFVCCRYGTKSNPRGFQVKIAAQAFLVCGVHRCV